MIASALGMASLNSAHTHLSHNANIFQSILCDFVTAGLYYYDECGFIASIILTC